ncbi:hypothetical protein [uncultured Nostoc sp.]|uniref:hypothetical protein n=1 Tax=uncultured Nostoc sp. TaxID=340711 RepID=UPI0035C9D1F5
MFRDLAEIIQYYPQSQRKISTVKWTIEAVNERLKAGNIGVKVEAIAYHYGPRFHPSQAVTSIICNCK